MSKETKPKKTRSTKKVSEGNTAELEAKIAELEAKLANLSSQVKPAETRPAQTAQAKPAPAPAPKPRPTASGPTHGTLPAGMKPTPPPAPKEEPRAQSYSAPEPGQVAPAYAQTSSTGYTGNKYYATRARLSYHPPNKQFKGEPATGTSSTTTTAPPPPPKAQRGTLPAGTKPAQTESYQTAEAEAKKSMWRSKGAEYENYVSEETHKAPPPAPEPKAQRGTLPAGFKAPPPPAQTHEAPKPAPAPAPKPRPTASGPTHGTLPAGMKPTPPPAPKEEPRSTSTPEVGEVAPAYAQISSSGYTGNRYYATRSRLSYHPPSKQFKGDASSSTTTAPPPAPAPKKAQRGTLPAGFKP